MTTSHHIAQANIALGRAPLTDPVMEGFVQQLDYINSVADRSPGFVWRLQTEEGDATGVRVFDDPLIILNLSVWETLDALFDYVFRSDHRGPLSDRRKWFARLDRPHSVLWWIRRDQLPTVADAEHRLDVLATRGPSQAAFTFARLFGPDGEPLSGGRRMDRGCGV